MGKKESSTSVIIPLVTCLRDRIDRFLNTDVPPQYIGSGPYPEILFHFTRNKEFLHGILATGFKYCWAREKIEGKYTLKEFGVPMVSFCDLRLSELPIHMDKYGLFGIGLSKSWAIDQGLNPVAYVNKNSEFTNFIFDGLEIYFAENMAINDWKTATVANHAYMYLFNILRYIKNYEGVLERDGKSGHYRFADEREWRAVLSLHLEDLFPVLPLSRLASRKLKESANEYIQSHLLKYLASDVRYIIVPTESDRQDTEAFISTLSSQYGISGARHLLSRILTAEQIRQDM